ncbi:hypothetical protein [Streptantibioticus silvisoli]|uniref:Tail assembly chaperone n=1 Tax=Streptantibioticus silvisoli TaxID=2705255 RepID=A0ABT6W7R4_9ACTN|nr:hypothetical protein [Streptantibioticus silvisoli]MDI5965718.1 hypothetical protein [Streptantibioticus silvisoli]
MSGYNNRFVLLTFPELGEKVSVLLRNPKLQPPNDLTPEDVPVDADGEPVDQKDAERAVYKMVAGLIVDWRVYDASASGETPAIDLDADDLDAQMAALEAADQVRLDKVTPENVARLPMAILNRISEEIGRVADPQ